MTPRNRIVGHRRVRAGDLVAHEHNWRRHPPEQRAALVALYDEVGFARSLLAYERADGRLQLIDGHLRRDIDPEMLVDVEVLDVTPDEARKLLLSMDSLAGLAEADAQAVAALRQTVDTEAPALAALWQSLATSEAETAAALDAAAATPAEQFLILVECRDEAHQVELLQRLQADGITCKPLIS
jgi:predicted DNA-binding transcriptional regulator YafY